MTNEDKERIVEQLLKTPDGLAILAEAVRDRANPRTPEDEVLRLDAVDAYQRHTGLDTVPAFLAPDGGGDSSSAPSPSLLQSAED